MSTTLAAEVVGIAQRTARFGTRPLLVVTVIALLALSTGMALGARTAADTVVPARAAAEASSAEQHLLADPTPAPSIAGVAEARRIDGNGAVVDAASYPMLTSQNSFDWPMGSGAGGTASGAALLAWPRLAESNEPGGSVTTLAVTNLVRRPGFTDYAILIYDQNGLLDYVLAKLNEEQTEYFNLGTWGFINPGWIGSAIVSACFWEHDVFSERGEFQRNLVGLAGVAFDSKTDRGGASGDFASGSVAVPLVAGMGPEYGPALGSWSPCGNNGPPIPPMPTPVHTATLTPTPTMTPTPVVPPPYAPDSPEVSLPALGQLRADNQCWTTLRVQNVGREDATALAVFWGQPGQCPPDSSGPSKAMCSGLIKPGSTWEFTPLMLPSAARSAVVFSFTSKLLSKIGVDVTTGPPDGPVADYMCSAVPGHVVGSPGGYATFKQAYGSGGSYLDVPMSRAWGAPLVVQVHRLCEEPPGIDLGVQSSYEGASGPDLGYAAPGESYSYSLPRVAALDQRHSSVVHIQNEGNACATVDLAIYDTSPASSRCESPVTCAVPPIAPGESVSVDIADCRAPGFEGSGVVTSNVPLAIVVDDAGRATLASYGARASSLREMHGEPLLAASGTVNFAPLLFKNYQGWTSRLHMQDLGPGQATLKVVILDRSGDTVSTGWFGPLCAFEGVTIDLETMPGIPHSWVGSARVESYPAAPPEATPWVPAPTSTPKGTVGPSPTRTPCSGTCPPTSTPTHRPPTATPGDEPTSRPATVEAPTPTASPDATSTNSQRLFLPSAGQLSRSPVSSGYRLRLPAHSRTAMVSCGAEGISIDHSCGTNSGCVAGR